MKIFVIRIILPVIILRIIRYNEGALAILDTDKTRIVTFYEGADDFEENPRNLLLEFRGQAVNQF